MSNKSVEVTPHNIEGDDEFDSDREFQAVVMSIALNTRNLIRYPWDHLNLLGDLTKFFLITGSSRPYCPASTDFVGKDLIKSSDKMPV